MLFLLQISRFFSRSNLICKWKWLYLPCRYRSYVGSSWKFMFWTYLQKKKIDPAFISGWDELHWRQTSGAAHLCWTTALCEQVWVILKRIWGCALKCGGLVDFKESTEILKRDIVFTARNLLSRDPHSPWKYLKGLHSEDWKFPMPRGRASEGQPWAALMWKISCINSARAKHFQSTLVLQKMPFQNAKTFHYVGKKSGEWFKPRKTI